MPRRILAAVLLAAVPLSACNGWKAVEVLPDPMPRRVRAQRVSGDQVELREPRLEADTLVGLLPDDQGEARVPMGEVVRLERWENDTTALVMIGFAGLVGLLFLVNEIIEAGIGPGS